MENGTVQLDAVFQIGSRVSLNIARRRVLEHVNIVLAVKPRQFVVLGSSGALHLAGL